VFSTLSSKNLSMPLSLYAPQSCSHPVQRDVVLVNGRTAKPWALSSSSSIGLLFVQTVYLVVANFDRTF
jgi:hypothetical protein